MVNGIDIHATDHPPSSPLYNDSRGTGKGARTGGGLPEPTPLAGEGRLRRNCGTNVRAQISTQFSMEEPGVQKVIRIHHLTIVKTR